MKNRPVFFDDLSGLITTAKIVAKQRNVSLAEASDFLEKTLIEDGTMIYSKVDGHQVEELGEAWYAPTVDYVSDVLGGDWWARSELLDQPLQPLGFLRDELAISNIDAVRLFEFVGVDSERNNTPLKVNSVVVEIAGQTFSRLQRSIAAFPVRYPDYQSQPPKLKDDVRVWLKEAALASSDREAHVFGTIIAEHFNFSGDTQET